MARITLRVRATTRREPARQGGALDKAVARGRAHARGPRGVAQRKGQLAKGLGKKQMRWAGAGRSHSMAQPTRLASIATKECGAGFGARAAFKRRSCASPLPREATGADSPVLNRAVRHAHACIVGAAQPGCEANRRSHWVQAASP